MIDKIKENELTKKINIKKIPLNIIKLLLSDFLSATIIIHGMGGYQNILNRNSVNKYHDVISDFSLFLEENGIIDDLDIYTNYNYALWNGYLSNYHSLSYSTDRELLFSNAGLTNIKGNGVCLNYSEMLTRILKEMGYEAYTVMCYVDKDKIDHINNVLEIDRNVIESNSLFTNIMSLLVDSPLTYVFGNHAITCVYDKNGDIHFYDPTNLAILNKSGFVKIEIANGAGELSLRPVSTIMYGDVLGAKSIFNLTKNYTESFNDNNVLSKELLEDFYNKEKDIYNDIASFKYKNHILLELFFVQTVYCIMEDTIKKAFYNVQLKRKKKI